MNILKGHGHSFFFVRVYNSLMLNHQRLILKYFDKIELKDKYMGYTKTKQIKA
ncbi:hypothetical protein JCM17204_25570 [Blautia stercoris]